jgi:phosphoribosyl 1,2-cyclic phosphate phosphodiesterase
VKLIILGSGTSTGVPRIGNDWGDCDPAESRSNRRSRVSIMVESDDGSRLLVDTPPDLRSSCSPTGSTGSTRCSGPTIMPITATASMICGRCAMAAPGRFRPMPHETVRRLRQRFGYVFAGQHGYPTIVSSTILIGAHVRGLRRGGTIARCRTAMRSTAYRFDQGRKINRLRGRLQRDYARDGRSVRPACDVLVSRLPAPRTASDACASGRWHSN